MNRKERLDKVEESVIRYMKTHWPSEVRPEWRVADEEYVEILERVLESFTKDKTKGRRFFRICGQSGSGKTSQLLPAVEQWFESRDARPVLVAARLFVPYHPYAREIEAEYGTENLRRMTDEVSTILMFLTLRELIKEGYDIILDVTLLDPLVERALMQMLRANDYDVRMTMVAVAKEISDYLIGQRQGRVVAKSTSEEFWRATRLALDFFVEEWPDLKLTVWNMWDEVPVFAGAIADGALAAIEANWRVIDRTLLEDLDSLRLAKINYLKGWE